MIHQNLPKQRERGKFFDFPNPLMEKEGFETLDLIACEGVVSMIEEMVNELADELWQAWVDLKYRLGKDPMVHGAA